jgi:hypothetical protein
MRRGEGLDTNAAQGVTIAAAECDGGGNAFCAVIIESIVEAMIAEFARLLGEHPQVLLEKTGCQLLETAVSIAAWIRAAGKQKDKGKKEGWKNATHRVPEKEKGIMENT